MMTLSPAYGRDYKNKKELQADIDANKDFILNDCTSRWNGKPCSPQDFKGQTVMVRYGKMMKITNIKIK